MTTTDIRDYELITAIGYLIDAMKYHLNLRDDDTAKRSLENARAAFIRLTMDQEEK